jgi:hypothetical protein
MAYVAYNPGSTLAMIRRGLRADGRLNRAVAALVKRKLLTDRKGLYFTNTDRRPGARARKQKRKALPKAPKRVAGGRNVPHRNTSAAQKVVLHFVDRYSGVTEVDCARSCAYMSIRGESGLRSSIRRLIKRGFLRETKAGLLHLTQPLETLPPAAQPLGGVRHTGLPRSPRVPGEYRNTMPATL